MTNRKESYQCRHCGESFIATGINPYCSLPCAFWDRTEKLGPTDCWEWSGGRHNFGYGELSFRGDLYRAHRVSYQIKHGWANTPEVIRHSCDNPSCTNPNHLIGGTQADNMDDMARRNRKKTRKIPVSDIPVIRARRKNGETLAAIGKDYSVSPQAIRAIVTRTTYKYC